MSQEIIEKPNYDVATYEDAGAGTEGFTQETLTLPYIKMIQKASPECDPATEVFNDAIRPGMYVNSATGRIYGTGLDVVVAQFQHRVNEWAPRSQGGGLRGVYLPKDRPLDTREVVVENRKRTVRENGNFLEDSFYYYALVNEKNEDGEGDGEFDMGVISFKSTGLTIAKRFNMSILSQKVRTPSGKVVPKAIYSQLYRFQTIRKENSMGVWYMASISRARELSPDEELYQQAKAFNAIALGAKVHGEESENVAASETPSEVKL